MQVKEMLIILLLSTESIKEIIKFERKEEDMNVQEDIQFVKIIEEFTMDLVGQIITVRQGQPTMRLSIYAKYLSTLMSQMSERMMNNQFEVIRNEIREVIERRFCFLLEKSREMKAKLVEKKVILRQTIISMREEISKVQRKNILQNILLFIDSTKVNSKIFTKKKNSETLQE